MEDQMIQNSASDYPVEGNVLPPIPEGYQMVTILLSNDSPQKRKDLHCLGCGRIVAQYYSEVRVIIIGEMREVARPVDIMCSRCKILFRIG